MPALVRSPTMRLLLSWVVLAIALIGLALARPVDHDESQYVAAAALTARGLVPYRDFAYLQSPLQPFLFAPLAAMAGSWAWPALRLVNALLGGLAVLFVFRAARTAGADAKPSMAAAALFAATGPFLFSVGVARNDALPLALLAAALAPILAAERGRSTPATAALTGLLLAAAAAAKVSYAIPALAYGAYSLWRREHRPAWIVAGAAPVAIFVLALWRTAPEGFYFGVFDFPARAPLEYYAAHPWKLSLPGRLLDFVKFAALGAALPLALLVVLRRKAGPPNALEVLTLAGIVAALLPAPTWRQYLAPLLPPLFVLGALRFQERSPGAGWRIALAGFTAMGLVETAIPFRGGQMGFPEAAAQSARLGSALANAGVSGPVASLSPQFVSMAGFEIAPHFATGPFYFRSAGLLDERTERRLKLVSHARPRLDFAAAVVTGGEARATSGNPALDARLAQAARAAGWTERIVPHTRFRIFVRARPLA